MPGSPASFASREAKNHRGAADKKPTGSKMLSKFWQLKPRDWLFIVLFDLTVLYIGYRMGRQAAEKED